MLGQGPLQKATNEGWMDEMPLLIPYISMSSLELGTLRSDRCKYSEDAVSPPIPFFVYVWASPSLAYNSACLH
jgi:hypothetical protein